MRKRTLNIVLGVLGVVLLVPMAGRGQPNGWHYASGNLLRAVKFIGQEGWVVGSLGHIMHTSDGGGNWELQVSGTSQDLLSLSFINPQTGWIGGMSGTFLKTTDGGRNWAPQTPPSIRNITVFYLNERYGWITVGVDSIYRTTDGGLSWEVHAGPLGFGGWDEVAFVDSTLGWAIGGGHIIKTTNGGVTWESTATFPDPEWHICMVDSENGWAVYWPGKAYRTRDGWRTWVVQPISIGGGLNDVSFQDTLTGYLCGGANNVPATVYWTTNGGTTWLWDSMLVRGDNALYGVDGGFLAGWAMAVGKGGPVIKTTNAGTTWRVIRNVDVDATSLLNVAFRDSNRGWAVGTYGVITHTTNGGTVWNRQASGTPAFLWGVDFSSLQKGWVCGESGLVLATSNAGTNWGPQTSNTTMPLFSIDFPDTNTLVGVAVGGYYGPPEPPGPFNPSPFPSPKAFGEGRWAEDTLKPWGTGYDFWKWPWNPQITQNPQTPYRTIIRTTNGGALWIAQNTSSQVPLYGVSFLTQREGWACGDPQGGMGVILHTTDSGATWTGQSSNVNQTLNWIQFRDIQNGWCVGSGGTALWTTDGGTTWNQGNTGTTSVLWSCAFYDDLNGFACGNNGLLIKTTDGGRNWTPDTSKVYANLMAVNALDSLHAWTVGSYGMVLGWRLAGTSGVEQGSTGAGELRVRNGIKAWPNPFVSFARVPGREKDKFSLYDITGRKIGTYTGERIGAEISSGVYFLMAEGKEGRPKRIVKVR